MKKRIREGIRRIRLLDPAVRIIVVDGDSTDQTNRITEEGYLSSVFSEIVELKVIRAAKACGECLCFFTRIRYHPKTLSRF